MNLYVAFILFALIILAYWVLSELITILFRFTGLPDEKARFQVLSLLTGTGFTTRESEMILANRRRRRLAAMTTLFGYVFNLTIVTAFINVFVQLRMSEAEHEMLGVLIPLAPLIFIFICMRIPAVRAWCDERLARVADRFFGREDGNTVMLLDYIGKNAIAQVKIRDIPAEFKGKPLSESGLRENEGLLVMLVEHPGGEPEPASGHTVIEEGDKLTVFGSYAVIGRAFNAKERFADDE